MNGWPLERNKRGTPSSANIIGAGHAGKKRIDGKQSIWCGPWATKWRQRHKFTRPKL